MGRAVATLHDGGLVHGDLTTSNLLLRPVPGGADEVVVIDFGLAFNSALAEDRAVDLVRVHGHVVRRVYLRPRALTRAPSPGLPRQYVLERALTSAHAGLLGLVRRRGVGGGIARPPPPLARSLARLSPASLAA